MEQSNLDGLNLDKRNAIPSRRNDLLNEVKLRKAVRDKLQLTSKLKEAQKESNSYQQVTVNIQLDQNRPKFARSGPPKKLLNRKKD